MADNTSNEKQEASVQWWTKGSLKEWLSIIGVFLLISGGVESIKSSVSAIQNSVSNSEEKVKNMEININKILEENKRLNEFTIKYGYEIDNLKNRMDYLEKKIIK